MKDLEKEVGDLRDAKAIAQEVITAQAEKAQDLAHKMERLALRMANKHRGRYGKVPATVSQVWVIKT